MTDVDVDPPAVPEQRLAADGWTRAACEQGVRAHYPGGRVLGHTHVYEDESLRAALRTATEGALDRPWRVAFVTRLEFRPPLAPGLGGAVAPTVASAADREFRADLRERGFESVERTTTDRIRVGDGDRARCYRYAARTPVAFDGVDHVAARALLAVRERDGRFRLVGGAYPTDGFATLLDHAGVDDHDPDGYFDALVELVRDAG